MDTITTRTLESGKWVERTFDVRYSKREFGGWIVRLNDNDRELGWLTRSPDGERWEARVSSVAFRGQYPGDTGYVLDDVPTYLHNGSDRFSSRKIADETTRREAAVEILWHLVRHEAPAVGFGPHPAVRRWADR